MLNCLRTAAKVIALGVSAMGQSSLAVTSHRPLRGLLSWRTILRNWPPTPSRSELPPASPCSLTPRSRAAEGRATSQADHALERRGEPRIVRAKRRAPVTGAANQPVRSRSFLPRLIVERASPVIFATAARPPRPAVRTLAAANKPELTTWRCAIIAYHEAQRELIAAYVFWT